MSDIVDHSIDMYVTIRKNEVKNNENGEPHLETKERKLTIDNAENMEEVKLYVEMFMKAAEQELQERPKN